MSQQGSFSKMRQILPSVQNFIEALKDDLANRRSVLLLLPSTMRANEIWPLLRAYIAAKSFTFEEVTVADLLAGQSLLASMPSTLRVQWNSNASPLSIDHFYSNAGKLPDVAYFDGFDDLPSDQKNQMLQFFTEWSDASHIIADQGGNPLALCIITSSREILTNTPPTDTHRGVHWWWGVPSALEMKLICRILGNNQDEQMTLWMESILPAITGSDMALADHLWDDYDLTIEGLRKKLDSYAVMRNWDIEFLREEGVEEYEDSMTFHNKKSSLFRSSKIKHLWGKGILYWTPEYGVQLNTAVLALLGKEKEVMHRIWRGQVEYLLPMLDQIRLAICEKLTGLYGPAWPYKWITPKYEDDYKAVQKDPMACELGHLFHLLKVCKNMKTSRNLVPLVNQASYVRNELAHYRPVDYPQYERLMKEVLLISDG